MTGADRSSHLVHFDSLFSSLTFDRAILKFRVLQFCTGLQFDTKNGPPIRIGDQALDDSLTHPPLSKLGLHGGENSTTILGLPIPSSGYFGLPVLRCQNEQIRYPRQGIPEITTEVLGILFAMTNSTISDVLTFKHRFEFDGVMMETG
jgi:hypothetical protein